MIKKMIVTKLPFSFAAAATVTVATAAGRKQLTWAEVGNSRPEKSAGGDGRGGGGKWCSPKHGKRTQASSWIPPPIGTVKCNIDAAFFEDINSAGVSMVVRDVEGRFITARTTLIKGLRCVKEGEAIGLLEALSWIRTLDYPNVMFEVDAKTVHEATKEHANVDTEFGGIMERCRNLVATERGYLVHFVRRQTNEIAQCVS
ncbi:uncharacterized protein [Primulina eburnea]|uniref:uncharacterized protein n=1 Tax=Primulina eburnea TaxID=1245227 RepID=UPI003C6C38C0